MNVAMDRALAALAAALDGGTDLADQLRRATEVTVLDFLENPAEVTVCNTEIRSLEFDVPEPRVASFAILEMGNNAKAWFHPSGQYTAGEVAALYGTFALRIVGYQN